MKKEKMIAKRYAHALFELGRELDILDKIENDLKLVTDTIKTDDEFRKIVEHMLIRKDKKRELFRNVFSDKITEQTMSLLMLVITKGREMYLEEIYEVFYHIYLEAKNIIEVKVTSAVELTEEEVNLLENKLKEETGKNIKFEFSINPELIGGIILRIGDRVIDGSVRRRLNALEHRLKQTKLRQVQIV